MVLAITGAGMVTSLGMDKQSCFTQFCQGKIGTRPLQFFELERFNLKQAYEISAQQSEIKPDYRATQLLCMAIAEAIAEAQLNPNHGRLAVLVGTGLRELRALEQWWAGKQSLQVAELHFGNAVQQLIGCDHSVITLSNACSASNFALGLAEDMITLGEVDTAIVAGCDSLTESMFGLSAGRGRSRHCLRV
jgi:3-oxoacyl-[acyl-carrier-protein] synthase II